MTPIEIIIHKKNNDSQVALREDDQLKEIHIEKESKRVLEGNIYKGKVVRVLPGMQAAFVDFGDEKNGFLYAANAFSSRIFNYCPDEKFIVPDIRELVYEGKEILVKVEKDPIGTKGARLSTEITLPSRYLVFVPKGNRICVSMNIKDEKKREQLTACVSKFCDESGSFIIRTAAINACEKCLERDALFLKKLWQRIEHKIQNTKVKSLIYSDISLAQRLIRDFVCENINTIIVDDETEYHTIKEFLQDFFPEMNTKVLLHQNDKPIFDYYHIDNAIENALQKRVDLDCGGYLIIEQTETLTTIDVNSGSYVGKNDLEQTVFNTNIQAAKKVAQQLRLRNLAGIIIIDFIDMKIDSHKKQVLEVLEQELAKDRVKTTVCGFTSLGLVEMTRKRTRESLANMLCIPCDNCGGTGVHKCFETIAFEIKNYYLNKLSQKKAILYLSPQLDYYFSNEYQGQQLWQELQQISGNNITKIYKNYFNIEQFELIEG